jgi:hypothetical protein
VTAITRHDSCASQHLQTGSGISYRHSVTC